jgi:antitoxin component of MazEF toxin-antitoxin module
MDKTGVSFIKKVVKSRNSYLLWIPKDEAEFLNINDSDFVKVSLEKINKEKKEKKGKK